jgi:uncharacterized membrane protein
MTELMVAAFSDAYRAEQVLYVLRRLEWEDATDLDHAICVAHHEDGRIKVQQTVDPADVDSVTWPALWSALITAAMLGADPFAMPAAAGGMRGGGRAEPGAWSPGRLPPAGWWTSAVGVSPEFLRDLGAVLMPGCSAVLVLVRAPATGDFATRLRRSGATVLRQPLKCGQVAAIQEMLDRAAFEPRP